MQLAGFHMVAMDPQDRRSMLPTEIGEMRFLRQCRPGEHITLEARLRVQDQESVAWDARGLDDEGRTICRFVRCACTGFRRDAVRTEGAAVARDRQEVIVQAVRLVPLGASSSMPPCQGIRNLPHARPAGRKTITGSSPSSGNTFGKGRPLWKRPHFSNRVALPIQIVHDTLGRPAVPVGRTPGPGHLLQHGGQRSLGRPLWRRVGYRHRRGRSTNSRRATPCTGSSTYRRVSPGLGVGGRRISPGLGAALVYQRSRRQGPGVELSSCGSAGHPHFHPSAVEDGEPAFSARLSGKALGASSPRPDHDHLGTFASPGRRVAFRRRLESAATSSRRAELL